MKKQLLFIVLYISVGIGTIYAQAGPEKQIRRILKEQTAAWNRGDIDAFMQGYWNNDSLLFVGKNGPTYGFTNTLNNYKKNYPNKDYMGLLNFTLLEVKPLSKQLWMVLGKWELTRNAGNVSGHYTLLFKKINSIWVIIMDHSS
ncbi:nuclear transport factor 2 family protein [Sediminibacterium sp.]|uniref:YybH family protein n=1 Tax=Sediminibacterium sp. TaxID=1917865 RepID=UPI00271BA55B|nr:nuclear transport factor 2 family protein [Sediminibacterium sp.]MDO9157261.1 nuclear transport factor 2 family protein [Sediminibacterium sp.]MDP2422458.1 nuclear transport factor 2 family protein [Sediminibacterium sp.]